MKPELLLPGGSIDAIRAAAENGADAVYFGAGRFNARLKSSIDLQMIGSIIRFLQSRGKKAYIAANTLIKNNEITGFLELVHHVKSAGADAIIIQDLGMIPLIRKAAPNLPIHLSTQATVTNPSSIPEGVVRVVLPRELTFSEIEAFSRRVQTEAFIHGALCFSYSGQCLFSSIVGGRSGNRGTCAQPCRKRYNNSFLMSTKDLCLIGRIPALIDAGIASFKVEGRLRDPVYVGTAARIYRKAIDSAMEGTFSVSKRDLDDLRLAFNREFSEGFAFEQTITDSRMPSHRGLFLGKAKGGKVTLCHDLDPGDTIGVWRDGQMHISKNAGRHRKGESIPMPIIHLVFKLRSVRMKPALGEPIPILPDTIPKRTIILPRLRKARHDRAVRLHVIARTRSDALSADEAGADIIYLFPDLAAEMKSRLKHPIGIITPRILGEPDITPLARSIGEIGPASVLCGNRGLLPYLSGPEVFLDYSFNIFNDYDLLYYGLPAIISPELTVDEVNSFADKRLAVFIHGYLILMTTKEPLKAPELIDDQGRHFRVRKNWGYHEILNCNETGLFTKVREYKDVKDFFIDTASPGKMVRIYEKILSGEPFDDRKIGRGYTTGRMKRPVI